MLPMVLVPDPNGVVRRRCAGRPPAVLLSPMVGRLWIPVETPGATRHTVRTPSTSADRGRPRGDGGGVRTVVRNGFVLPRRQGTGFAAPTSSATHRDPA